MHIQVAVRHEASGHGIQSFVESELRRLEAKYEILSAEVIIDQDGPTGTFKKAEIILKVKGNVLVASETSDDIHKSIDLAVKKLDAQLHKHKELYTHPTSLKRQSGNDGKEDEVNIEELEEEE